MKQITWVTPTFFIDVDIQIVPKLSEKYKIIWVVFGNKKPEIFSHMEGLQNDNLMLEYYEIKSKWYSPMYFFENIRMNNNLKQKNSDIIYYDSAPQLFAYYAAILSLPVDNTIFATHNVKTPKGASREAMARYYMGKLLRHYKNFHVFSYNQKLYLESWVSGKNVLFAPLTLKDYGQSKHHNYNSDCINFLSFGHIRKYKRIDILIMAAQKLYEETNIKFKVTITGTCKNWDDYMKLIKYPDLFDLRIGFVDDNSIPKLFANADYLVLPYQDLAQSGAITVAFNYNIPVITSDIPQFKEFVEEGQNGFLFKSESIEDLKDKMKMLLEKPKSEYLQLQMTTKKYVEKNYSLQAIADKYIDYLDCF